MTEKITVIGSGTMGSGIAQVAVGAGFQVNLVDTEQGFVDRGVANIRKFVEKKVAKGKLNQIQCDEILARLSGTTDMAQAVKGVVMVVEAVFEKFELKKEIFQKLDALCPPDVILASMTLYHCSLRWFEASSQADFEDLPSSLVQPRGALTT